jgi:hypothetical protein
VSDRKSRGGDSNGIFVESLDSWGVGGGGEWNVVVEGKRSNPPALCPPKIPCVITVENLGFCIFWSVFNSYVDDSFV